MSSSSVVNRSIRPRRPARFLDVFRTILLGLLSGTCFASGDVTTAYAPPAGYCKVSIAGHGSSVIGVPLLKDVIAAGCVVASATNQITVRDASWSVNQFASSEHPYYMEVASGELIGRAFRIVENTRNTVTLDCPDLTGHLKSDEDGDLVRIREAWTVGELLGATDETVVLTSATSAAGLVDAETVSIPDNQSVGVQKRPLLNLGYVSGQGWMSQSGTDNLTNLPILPGGALITHRFGNLDSTELLVVGQVGVTALTLPIPAVPTLSVGTSGTGAPANDFYFAPVIADPVSLDDAGLLESGTNPAVVRVSNSVVDRSDELIGFAPGTAGVSNPDAEKMVVYIGGQWQELGATGSASLQFEPGKGYLLRRKAGSPAVYWTQPAGYQSP